jgi:hypothetical protein
MDILRCRGKRGYEAFLEALEFYYPEHFTLLTGQEPAQRCSMILGERVCTGALALATCARFLTLTLSGVHAHCPC